MGQQVYKTLIVVLLCWCQVACVKDKPAASAPASTASGSKVYVVCEGNFGNGDASLYAWNTTSLTVSGDLYSQANGAPLGDVFQSMQRIGNKYYLCINNSDRIVVLDTGTLHQSSVISVPKPRYMLQVSATKAYVSSLFTNRVFVIDLPTAQVTDTITLTYSNTEGMCMANGYAWVCMWDTAGHYIAKLDAGSNTVAAYVPLPGYAPQEAVLDKEQMMWVLAGNKTKGRVATLTRLDPSTGSVLKSFTFPSTADPLKPVMNGARDSLYFIEVNYNGGSTDNGIYRMSIYDAALPATPFVSGGLYQYFWALGIEPGTGNIYVGDPKNFVQKGSVSIYRPDGALLHTFACGVGPGHFYFP